MIIRRSLTHVAHVTALLRWFLSGTSVTVITTDNSDLMERIWPADISRMHDGYPHVSRVMSHATGQDRNGFEASDRINKAEVIVVVCERGQEQLFERTSWIRRGRPHYGEDPFALKMFFVTLG